LFVIIDRRPQINIHKIIRQIKLGTEGEPVDVLLIGVLLHHIKAAQTKFVEAKNGSQIFLTFPLRQQHRR